MTDFPLYQMLASKTEASSTLSETQKDMFIDEFKHFSTEQHELIYVLIRQYQLEHNQDIYHLPYSSKKFKRGIRIDFDKLPSILQCILFEFLLLHINSIADSTE